MTVLSYIGPAAVVLALSWAVVKLTRMPVGTPSLAAVTAVVVFALIAVTPLCGFMFNCGCHWPWADHCNFFDALSKLKCPWCNNVAAGALSMACRVRRQHLRRLLRLIDNGERQRPLHHRRARRRRDLSSRFACHWRAGRSRHRLSAAIHGLASIARAGARNSSP